MFKKLFSGIQSIADVFSHSKNKINRKGPKTRQMLFEPLEERQLLTVAFDFLTTPKSTSWGNSIELAIGGPIKPDSIPLYLSPDANITGDDMLLSITDFKGYNLDGYLFYVVVQLPGSFPLGYGFNPDNTTWYIGVRNSDGSQLVSNAFSITPAPGRFVDLKFNSFTASANNTYLGNCSINYSFVNNGTVTASPFTAGVYFSKDNYIDSSDILLYSYEVASLNPGSGYNYTYNLSNINEADLAAHHYVLAALDTAKVVAESNEGNNIASSGYLNLRTPFDVAIDNVSGSSRTLSFGSFVNDGYGTEGAAKTITMKNLSSSDMVIYSYSFDTGSNFYIESITSSTQGTIDLFGKPLTLKANSAETWTIKVGFNAGSHTGTFNDNLKIYTKEHGYIQFSLNASATAKANLVVTTPDKENDVEKLAFPDTAYNANASATKTFTLSNNGSGALTINANGITVSGSKFRIKSIVSSSQGAIDLSSAQTIAPYCKETWTVTVEFTPASGRDYNGTLTVAYVDTNTSSTTRYSSFSVTGTGKSDGCLQFSDVSLQSGKSISFNSVHADGIGGENQTYTFEISNKGNMDLLISKKGFSFEKGTNFKILSIVSSRVGEVDLENAAATIKGNKSETWTVTLAFDPVSSGSLTDKLTIETSSISNPNTTLSLSGTGLNTQELIVRLDDQPAPSTILFDDTLGDGTGAQKSYKTLTLTNPGAKDLTIYSNGIALNNNSTFKIISVVSSKQGDITSSLKSSSKKIAAKGQETWTVTIAFDPALVTQYTDTLSIYSNTLGSSQYTRFALNGSGVKPSMALTCLEKDIVVSAGDGYAFTWSDEYTGGNAKISLYYDTDKNSSNGKTLIKSGINEDGDSNEYLWMVPQELQGLKLYIYYQIEDGNQVMNGYASGAITVIAQGSVRLLSAPVSTSETYTLRYNYNGDVYSESYNLSMGSNTLYHTAKGTTQEFHIQRVASLAANEQYEYDDLGRLTSVNDASGAITTCEYDILNQLTKITYASGETVEFTYDAVGNTLSMHDDSGWQLYTYDALNRMTEVWFSQDSTKDSSDDVVRYAYDLNDQLTKITYPSGKSVSYTYDSAGRVLTVKDNAGTTSYSYDSRTGLVSMVTRPNGTRTKYTYNNDLELSIIRHEKTSGSALIEEIAYTRDAAGRVTKSVFQTPNNTRAEAYTYDEYDQLTKVVYSEDDSTIESTDRTVTYTYNKLGSRTRMTDDPDGSGSQAAEITSYTYGAGNRLTKTTDGSGNTITEYFYDAQGNLVMEVSADKTVRYFYDTRGLLIGYTDGETTVSYEYDMAGRRIAKVVNGERTEYVNDVSGGSYYQVLEECDGNGNVTKRYTYGTERISATGQNTEYYLTDQLGSVRAVSTNAGATKGYVTYDTFGKVLSDPASLVSLGGFGYAGANLDAETGQFFLRARYMDPETGRFTQKDPLGAVDSFDEYVYCADDPVNRVDPSGEIAPAVIAAVALRVAVGAASGAILGASCGWIYASLTHAADQETSDIIRNCAIGGGIIGSGFGALWAAHAIGVIGATGTTTLVSTTSTGGAAEVAEAVNATRLLSDANKIQKVISTLQKQANAIMKYSGNARTSGTFQSNWWEGIVKSSTPKVKPAPTSSFQMPSTNQMLNAIKSNISNIVKGLSVLELSIHALPSQSSTLNGDQYINYGTDIFQSPIMYSNEIQIVSFDCYGEIVNYGSGFSDLGGVCLDKAADLIGSNLSDIQGAVYDPNSGQLIFIGEKNNTSTQGVNTDFLFTAIQQAYSSNVPSYVTLDPPGHLSYNNTFNPETSNNVIAKGSSKSFSLVYNPLQTDDNESFYLMLGIDGTNATIEIAYADGQTINHAPMLEIKSRTGLPDGVTVNITGQIVTSNTSYTITIANSSGSSVTVNDVFLIPTLQHRGLSSYAENTMLGWVMYEADCVMKSLSVGADLYTNEIYDSSSDKLPTGFKSMFELTQENNITGEQCDRFWFTPKEVAIEKSEVDGTSSMLFSKATVELKTENMLNTGTSNPAADQFVKFFNDHFEEFAQLEFPVSDPEDPSGESVIYVKIFSLLQEALKATSLAQFFKDNDIPLDTWWLNSYTPQEAYIPKTIPTIMNVDANNSSHRIYGGVRLEVANTHVPSTVINSVIEKTLARRKDGETVWSLGSTDQGNLEAVSLALQAQTQDGNVSFSMCDLSFAAAGSQSLSFVRSYNSGYMANNEMGTGWSVAPCGLQFQRSLYKDELRVLRTEDGAWLHVDSHYDTLYREGEIRFVDYQTGETLKFQSSFQIMATEEIDSNGVKTLKYIASGLDSTLTPTFTLDSSMDDGSTLTQNSTNGNYTLTRPDGTVYVIDRFGNVQSITDSRGYSIRYNWEQFGTFYDNYRLTSISSYNNQGTKLDTVWIHYNSDGKISEVCGPDSETASTRKVVYEYSDELLVKATAQVRKNGTYVSTQSLEYNYSEDGRLTSIKTPSGLNTINAQTNETGQKTSQFDTLGNSVSYYYSTDANGNRIMTVVDNGNSSGISIVSSGINALRYVSSSGSSQKTTDSSNRTTSTINSKGIQTSYTYTGESLYVNGVTINLDGYQTVTIERNAQGLPTKITNPNNPQASPILVEYNSANLPTRITDAKGVVTTYEYTTFNAVSKITEAVGTSLQRSTIYTYDATTKYLASVKDPLGNVIVRYTYDNRGRVLTETDAAGIKTTYSYDDLGRISTVTACGYTISYEYDINNNVTKVTTPKGNSVFTYDQKTQALTSVKDVFGREIRYTYDYEYDSQGNVTGGTGLTTSVRQVSSTGNSSNDRKVDFEYDLRGNLVLTTMPDNSTSSWRYDELGNEIGSFEDDKALPTIVNTRVDVQNSTKILTFTASETILTANLKYWQLGSSSSSSSAMTESIRVGDKSEFSIDISHLVVPTWNYTLTLTDSQGNQKTVTGSFETVMKLAAPTATVRASCEDTAIVTFDNVASAYGYTLEYSTDSSFSSNVTTMNVSSGEILVRGLNENTTYYFRLRANGYGTYSSSDYSFVKSVKTYAADDVSSLRAFLEQTANGKSNGVRMNSNYKSYDVSTWSAATWTETDGVMRLSALQLSNSSDPYSGSLDLSGCTALTVLNCSSNQLASVNVTGCTSLTELRCNSNIELNSLTVSGCSSLISLDCSSNKLTTLNLAGCTALEYLNCSVNQLKSIELLNSAALKDLNCCSNKLTKLHLSQCRSLTTLACYSNQLTELDISGCTALKTLECYSNKLPELYLSDCASLTILKCYSNQLSELNLANNAALTKIYCQNNQITELDISQNRALTEIYFWNTSLNFVRLPLERTKNVRISFSDSMTFKDANNNNLGTYSIYTFTPSASLPIYASNNSQTIVFMDSVLPLSVPTLTVRENDAYSCFVTVGSVPNASGYELQYSTSPNFAVNTKTTTVSAGTTLISDLSANTPYYFRVKAKGVGMYSNSDNSSTASVTTKHNDVTCLRSFLEQTDSNGVKNGVKLNSNYNAYDPSTWSDITWRERNGELKAVVIDWYGKDLSGSLDVTACTELVNLFCGGDQLTSINASGCIALKYMACQDSQIASLDLSGCTALRDVFCDHNQLTSLNVSGCTGLEYLYAYNNQLPSLDVSECVNLIVLQCDFNQLQELNVSGCASLMTLTCNSNKLSSLDLKDNTALKYLYCISNRLTEIDVSANPNLINFSCHSNNLTRLDLWNNVFLKGLYCWNSGLTSVKLPQTAIGNELLINLFGSSDSWTFMNAAGGVLSSNVTEKMGCTVTSVPFSAQSQSTGQVISFDYDFRTPLFAPTGLQSLNVTSSSASLRWNGVSNASGYAVIYSSSPSFTDVGVKSGIASTSTTISGLAPDTTYYFKVLAAGTGNYQNSNYSSPVSVHTEKIVDYVGDTISTGKNIVFSNNAFTFTDKIGEGDYGLKDVDIYRLTVSSSDINKIYTFTTSEPDEGVSADTYIRLFNSSGSQLAFNDDGTDSYSSLVWTPSAEGTYYLGVSSYSNRSYNPAIAGSSSTNGSQGDYTLSVTYKEKLTAPTLSISATGSNSVAVTVGSVPNASEYRVYYSTSSSFSSSACITVNAGTTTIGGLDANTTYYFRADAVGASIYINSEFSAVRIAKTDYIKLTPPTLSVSVNGSNEASVTVGNVDNVTNYTLQYSTSSSFNDAETKTVSAGSTSIIGLKADTMYYVRARANGSGVYTNSDYSAYQSFKTEKSSEPDISINGKKVTVSWIDLNSMADTVRYRVAGASKWTTVKLKQGVTTYSFNGQAGTNYEIEVLLDQQENNILRTSAVVLDQPKLTLVKNELKDDTFQVNVTNYTAKNLASNATRAILTVNGVQTTLDIVKQQGTGNLAGVGKVSFSNGLLTFTEMASNTSYKIQVSFSDGVSVSTASSALTVKTAKASYLSPAITSATAVSDTSIVVTWETSYGKKSTIAAQKYTVQYSTDGVKWTNATTGATGASYTIQKLKGGVEYKVRVLATKDNAFEVSQPSDVLTTETLALPKIALEKNSAKDDSFQLNVTNYQSTNLTKATTVSVKSDKFGTVVVNLQNGTGSAAFSNGMTVAFNNGALTFANVPSNTQQKIQVNFNNGVCTTAWSQALTVKTLIATYNKPVLISVGPVSSTSVEVNWETVYGKNSTIAAQKYTVQYSLDGNRWTNATTSATGTSFTITKLKPNTNYLVAVIANKDSKFNASQPSESLPVTTPM